MAFSACGSCSRVLVGEAATLVKTPSTNTTPTCSLGGRPYFRLGSCVEQYTPTCLCGTFWAFGQTRTLGLGWALLSLRQVRSPGLSSGYVAGLPLYLVCGACGGGSAKARVGSEKVLVAPGPLAGLGDHFLRRRQ